MPKAERARQPAAQRTVRAGGVAFSNAAPAVFVAGTCSFESPELLARVGRELKRVFRAQGAPWVLKCSFDKANRSSLRSYRGRGLSEALESFERVKRELGVPMLTDIHEPWQAEKVGEIVEILQIPAFLCRQTDLLLAAGRSGAVVNIKKGQFLSPWDMRNAIEKVESTGNRRILLTERGSSFGYANLVVDMRSLAVMAESGYPVVFDSTHSCQLPGALGNATGGQREYAPLLARAAAAVGVAGLFLETHPDPDRAKSDGPNSVRLRDVGALVRSVRGIDRLVKGTSRRGPGSKGRAR